MTWTSRMISALMRDLEPMSGFEPRFHRILAALDYLNWRLYPNRPRPRRRS